MSYVVKRLDEKDVVDFSSKYLNEEQNLKFFLRKTQDATLTISSGQIMIGDVTFDGNDIQWIGRNRHSHMISLDINSDGTWYRLYINSSVDPEKLWQEILKQTPEKLRRSRYFYRPEIRTHLRVIAHITTRNLQGIFEKHEEVELYITPLWMVVLHSDYVYQQHFIDDIKDIRCGKHPTDHDETMFLLTFETKDKAYAYALKNQNFATHLSDACREGIDKAEMRKKKKQM